MYTLPIRIGTRASKLALRQAEETRGGLIAIHGLGSDDVMIVPFTTTGDSIRDRPLADSGGKGLFTSVIERALLDDKIDIAVHSLKDMPSALPNGLTIAAVLARADPRDAFLSPLAPGLTDLPQGAAVGTASIRRRAQIKRLRPDLEVVPFRGNVETRLRKLHDGQVDATILACAGLMRLGLDHEITSHLDPEEMVPAIAQGAIGLEIRNSDDALREALAPLNHTPSQRAIGAERAFLATLGGSCHTPIAGLARIDDDRLRFRGMVSSLDGQTALSVERCGPPHEAAAIGKAAGEEMIRRGAAKFLT
ncbi:MAG: hydroxymethylbilane synthase [Hyphomicrobiales bacterium]